MCVCVCVCVCVSIQIYRERFEHSVCRGLLMTTSIYIKYNKRYPFENENPDNKIKKN